MARKAKHNPLNNMSIAQKLMMGFFIITVMIALMAYLGIKNFSDISNQLTIANLISDSQISLERARIEQVRFEGNGLSDTALKVYDFLDEAMSHADSAQALMKSETNRALVDQYNTAITNFDAQFNVFENLEVEKDAQKGLSEDTAMTFIQLLDTSLESEESYIKALTNTDTIEASFDKYLVMAELKAQFLEIQSSFNAYAEKPTDELATFINDNIDMMIAKFDELLSVVKDPETLTNLQTSKEELNTYAEAFNAFESDVNSQSDVSVEMRGYAVSASEFATQIDDGVQNYITNLRSRVNTLSIMSTTIAILFSIITAFLISRSITKPIKKTTILLEAISKYDLTSDVPMDLIARKDEVGILGRAMDNIVHSLRDILSIIQNASQELLSSAAQLSKTATETSRSADEVAVTIDAIALGATDQASSTENGALKVAELGRLIDEDRHHVGEAIVEANRVGTLKDEGLKVIQRLVSETERNKASTAFVSDIISQTNESVYKIEKASQMIQSIADQTNLLALNAAIEAARAGDAGRGFAVVAEEIRKLAEQSAVFTGDIQSVITELIEKANKAVQTMDDAKGIMKAQSDAVELTQSKFSGIADSINLMKRGIEAIQKSSEVMDGKKGELIDVITSLSAISEENAASTEEASASIEEQTTALNMISDASEELQKLAQVMQESVSKFVIS